MASLPVSFHLGKPPLVRLENWKAVVVQKPWRTQGDMPPGCAGEVWESAVAGLESFYHLPAWWKAASVSPFAKWMILGACLCNLSTQLTSVSSLMASNLPCYLTQMIASAALPVHTTFRALDEIKAHSLFVMTKKKKKKRKKKSSL